MEKIRKAPGLPDATSILCPVLLAVCVCTSGCILYGNTQPPPDLTGHEWRLQSYRDPQGNFISPVPGSTITITFDPSGRLSGKSGCNSYHGSYTIEGELLTVGRLAGTGMYCSEPEGLMDQEDSYLSLLYESTRYQVLDDTLILSYYDLRKQLVFKK